MYRALNYVYSLIYYHDIERFYLISLVKSDFRTQLNHLYSRFDSFLNDCRGSEPPNGSLIWFDGVAMILVMRLRKNALPKVWPVTYETGHAPTLTVVS